MSNKAKIISTDLICLECGTIITIQRKQNHKRKISHIKDLWCYECEKVTKHYEVQDVESFLETETNSSEKQKIKKLIRKRK